MSSSTDLVRLSLSEEFSSEESVDSQEYSTITNSKLLSYMLRRQQGATNKSSRVALL